MQITLLKVGTYSWGIIHTNALIEIARLCVDRGELVGQLLADDEKFNGFINLVRASHTIYNIRFNPITRSLIGDVKFIKTPYGEQLRRIMDHYPHRIHFQPAYTYDDSESQINKIKLITANAVYRKESYI